MQTTSVRVLGPTDGKAGFLGSIGVRFMIDGDAAGEYRELSTPDSSQARAWILAKYTAQHPKVFDRTTKTWIRITVPALVAA